MHNSHKIYLSNMPQVLLFFFQYQILWINNTALQNIHWDYLNIQLSYGFGYIFYFYM